MYSADPRLMGGSRMIGIQWTRFFAEMFPTMIPGNNV